LSFKTQKADTPITNNEPDCIGVCAIFNPQNYFTGEVSLDNTKTYTNPTTKNTVRFKLLTGEEYQARNATFEVYVNEKLAGTASGQGISQTSFSSDHKHFAFKMRSTVGCAGSCQSQTLYIVDLSQSISTQLLVNPNSGIKNNKIFQYTDTFIDSYSWGEDNTILPTVYSVGMGNSGKYYRTSPKEVWSFNLNNPQSIMRNGVLVNTLPE